MSKRHDDAQDAARRGRLDGITEALALVRSARDLDEAIARLEGLAGQAVAAVDAAGERRPHYTQTELLAQCDASADMSDEDRRWLDAEPVGLDDPNVMNGNLQTLFNYSVGKIGRREACGQLGVADCVLTQMMRQAGFPPPRASAEQEDAMLEEIKALHFDR